MAIYNERDLGKALDEDQETIEIEGDLKNKVLKIKATGKVAWAVAIGAITVAVIAALSVPASGGTTTPVAVGAEALVAPAAVSILGLPVTISAISIAVGAGSVAVLNKLRKYKIVEKSENRIVLKKN